MKYNVKYLLFIDIICIFAAKFRLKYISYGLFK